MGMGMGMGTRIREMGLQDYWVSGVAVGWGGGAEPAMPHAANRQVRRTSSSSSPPLPQVGGMHPPPRSLAPTRVALWGPCRLSAVRSAFMPRSHFWLPAPPLHRHCTCTCAALVPKYINARPRETDEESRITNQPLAFASPHRLQTQEDGRLR
jgi:hypothetical protein